MRLQVPAQLLADARVLLSQTWALATEDGDDLDEAWDSLAPEPGARRRAILRAAVVVILVLPLVRLLLELILRLQG